MHAEQCKHIEYRVYNESQFAMSEFEIALLLGVVVQAQVHMVYVRHNPYAVVGTYCYN
jgi:hypothetical protein